MDLDELLGIVKSVYGTKKAQLPEVLLLLSEIYIQNLEKLMDFKNDVVNVILDFEDDMDKLFEQDKKVIRDDKIISKCIMIVSGQIHSTNCQHLYSKLVKKIKIAVSEKTFKNEHLKLYIKDLEKKNDVIIKGVEFLFGVLKNLNGQKNAVALMITQMLNYTFQEQGITREKLLMIRPLRERPSFQC